MSKKPSMTMSGKASNNCLPLIPVSCALPSSSALRALIRSCGGKAVEVLAHRLARPRVPATNSGREKLFRRQRKLVPVLGPGLAERTARIHLGAAAPALASWRSMKVTHAAIGPGGRQLVGGNHAVGTAEKNAASPEVRTRKDSGSELAVPDAVRGFVWARGTAG